MTNHREASLGQNKDILKIQGLCPLLLKMLGLLRGPARTEVSVLCLSLVSAQALSRIRVT